MPAVHCGVTLQLPSGVLGRPGWPWSRAMTPCGRFAMTAPPPARTDFAVLDGLILEALGALRSARIGSARTGNRKNLELLTRAEAHLNALLDYRHAAPRRGSLDSGARERPPGFGQGRSVTPSSSWHRLIPQGPSS